MGFFSPGRGNLEAGVTRPPTATQLLVLRRSVPLVADQLATHLGVAVLGEEVQGQWTSGLVKLVVGVAWQVVLASDVVAFKLPFVLDVVHGDHPLLEDPSWRKVRLLDDVHVNGGLHIFVARQRFVRVWSLP